MMRRLPDDTRYARVMGGIYDAALDPALWTDSLHELADFTGGRAAGLLSKDTVGKASDVHYQFGADPDFVDRYREAYWRFDPLAPLLFFDVGRVTAGADVFELDEFRRGRFYQEWTRPQGFGDAANVVVDKSATSCAILSIIRDEHSGFVDDEMRRRTALMVPHIRRAILIGRAIDLKTVEAETFAETLDGVTAGVFLLGAGGRLIHSNAAGRVLLAKGECLFASEGRLAARGRKARQALERALLAAGIDDPASPRRGESVALTTEDGELFVAHVLPLAGATSPKVGASRASAAIFVHRAALKSPSPPEFIAGTYGLTPTELRVLLAIVEVGGVPEAAESLGVADTTVKTHLGHLFAKTGATQQADMVKLVAGLTSPLVN